MTSTRVFSWKYAPGGKIKINHIDRSRKGLADYLVVEDTGTQTKEHFGAPGSPEYARQLVSEIRQSVREKTMSRDEIYSKLISKLGTSKLEKA